MKKIWDLKKVFSNLELEGQGRGIIIEVTHLLLIGPFYTIQTKKDQTFWRGVYVCAMVTAYQSLFIRAWTKRFRKWQFVKQVIISWVFGVFGNSGVGRVFGWSKKGTCFIYIYMGAAQTLLSLCQEISPWENNLDLFSHASYLSRKRATNARGRIVQVK